MNSLSWFLYLADVVPNIGGLLFVLAFGLIVMTAAWALFAEEIGSGPPIRFLLWFIPVISLFSVLTPSKDTIYLIAGSEAGEYVVTSPEGQEIINDIKSIIKSQIEELK